MSTDYQADDHTTIRVHPATGGGYTATEIRSGYEIGPIGDGATEQDAHHMALDALTARENLDQDREDLESAGIYADLTTGPHEGIHRQMQAVAPSPVPTGTCPYCGLNERTCDCH